MKKNQKPTVAIMYDFDGTLSPGNMQEYTFIPEIGSEPKKFWDESNGLAKRENMDSVQAYMYLMVKKAEDSEKTSTREDLLRCGKKIKFFPGVLETENCLNWFQRINRIGEEIGLNIEHYIISSGLQEIIEGTPIAKEFCKIYASSFKYNKYKKPVWAARAVNYTTKTQYIFRINKGTKDEQDDKGVNQFVPDRDRAVPFSQMIYVGDGTTDVPCMSLVKRNGGKSIAVYPPKTKNARGKVISNIGVERFNFLLPADYSQGKDLEKVLTAILEEINARLNIQKLEIKFGGNPS